MDGKLIKSKLGGIMKASAARMVILPLIVLLTACASPGVKIQSNGESAVQVTPETEQQLPQGGVSYRVAPFDVLQVDVYPKRAVAKQRKVEYANEIRMEFYFNDNRYRIAHGDTLGLELAGESDKVYDVAVLPNGVIHLPRIGKIVTAIGLTPSELTAILKREYAALLRNPQVIVSVHKSGLEQLQRLSGNYTVDNDGQIVVPLLGAFRVVGMNIGQITAQVSEKAQSYFYNRIEVEASIQPFSSRQQADSRLAPDGQQYFRNTVKVSPDGSFFIPDAGIFLTNNKTLDELNKEIQSAFAQLYQNEVQVNVALNESPGLSVFIGGEVRAPGSYPYRASLTLLQLISVAGWLNDAADISQAVLLHAVEGNRYVLYKTNLMEVVNGEAQMKQDLKLSPRDIVIIPKSGIAKADQWVDQYIRRLLPFGMSVNYTISEQRGNVNGTVP